MNFDAFEEGIVIGGIRTKHEIRTLICYIFVCVDRPMSKEIVINSLMEKGLVNYFDAVTCFDELVNDGNIIKAENSSDEYTYTENAKIISDNLSDSLAKTARDRAIECTLALLEKSRIEKENTVEIKKIDNGYNVVCRISGGDMDLLSFTLYVPEINMARQIRKNFYKSPDTMYEVMIAMLTKNKKGIEGILESLKQVI